MERDGALWQSPRLYDKMHTHFGMDQQTHKQVHAERQIEVRALPLSHSHAHTHAPIKTKKDLAL